MSHDTSTTDRGTAPIADRDLVGYAKQRPQVPWPGGTRLAVSLVVNYEEGSEQSFAMGDTGQETSTEWMSYELPGNVRNLAMESMYEYGSRVGIWRIFDVLDRYSIKATFYACAVALEANQQVADAIVRGEHCVVSHGYRWEEVFRFDAGEEGRRMALAAQSFERTLGYRPRGWYCRYGPSVNTRRLLVEQGFEYDCDAYNDDQPYFVKVGGQPHLVIPYSPDCNDFRFWQSPGFTTGNDFLQYLKDSFDVLYAESSRTPLLMSVGLHPRQIGRPGRIKAIESFIRYVQDAPGANFLTRDEMADVWLARSDLVPADDGDRGRVAQEKHSK